MPIHGLKPTSSGSVLNPHKPGGSAVAPCPVERWTAGEWLPRMPDSLEDVSPRRMNLELFLAARALGADIDRALDPSCHPT